MLVFLEPLRKGDALGARNIGQVWMNFGGISQPDDILQVDEHVEQPSLTDVLGHSLAVLLLRQRHVLDGLAELARKLCRVRLSRLELGARKSDGFVGVLFLLLGIG